MNNSALDENPGTWIQWQNQERGFNPEPCSQTQSMEKIYKSNKTELNLTGELTPCPIHSRRITFQERGSLLIKRAL